MCGLICYDIGTAVSGYFPSTLLDADMHLFTDRNVGNTVKLIAQ